MTTARGWGGALAIRTGPAEFSQALVTLALRQGKHVADGYLIHGHPKLDGGCLKGANCSLILPTPEEMNFFAALDLSWIPPRERTPERLKAVEVRASQSGRPEVSRND